MFYRLNTNVSGKGTIGEVVEIFDRKEIAGLLAVNAIEEVDATHLVSIYGATGDLDETFSKTVDQLRAASAKLRDEIARLTEKIGLLVLEKSELLAGPAHPDDVLKVIRASVARHGEFFHEQYLKDFILPGQRNALNKDGYLFSAHTIRERAASADLGIPLASLDLYAGAQITQESACFFFGDQIVAGWKKIIDSLSWDSGANTHDFVDQRCAALDAEMADLQAQANTLKDQLAGVI